MKLKDFHLIIYMGELRGIVRSKVRFVNQYMELLWQIVSRVCVAKNGTAKANCGQIRLAISRATTSVPSP